MEVPIVAVAVVAVVADEIEVLKKVDADDGKYNEGDAGSGL